MVVIALLLLVMVVAVVVFVVVTGTSGTVTMEWDQLDVYFTPSPLVLFLLGAATLLLAVAALALLRAGSRRGLAKRKELKRLRLLDDQTGGAAPAGATTTTATAPAGATGHRSAPTTPGATGTEPPRS